MDQTEHARPAAKSSTALLIVVWLVVGVPALWGVSKTAETAFKLFQTQTIAASQPTTDH